MQQQLSYLKGTKHFLQWIEEFRKQYPELPPLFGLLTIDYAAMYVKMPDNLIIPAVTQYLDSRTHKVPSTASTMKLLEITARNNYFEFGEKTFKQTGGTSIGKKHAPDLCCLGAGKFEEDFIFPDIKFQELIINDMSKPDPKERFFRRFIDDMFAATVGTEQQIKDFVEWMNTLWPGLSFTFDWSNKEIIFLDVKLLVENGKLETDRFVKPTNPQLFLHYTSNHPKSVFKAIVYGQALTVKLICSKPEYIVRHVENLKNKFVSRGYPIEMVEENLQRGLAVDRGDLLKPRPVYPHQACPVIPSKPKFQPTFIITFNPHNPPLSKWLRSIHFILMADTKMSKIFPNPPSVSYRQPRNLRKILVKSTLKQLPFRDISDQLTPGCYKHMHGGRGRQCQLCPKLKEGNLFKSNYTGLSYKIRHHLTCKSKYCVYLISCNRCGKQYTGKSINYMHVRHCGHRQEIENNSSELGQHFNNCGYDNLSLQIIDCVKDGEDSALIQLEGVWQNRLATFQVHGNINIRNELR